MMSASGQAECAAQILSRGRILNWRRKPQTVSLTQPSSFPTRDPAVNKETQLNQEFLALEQSMRLLDARLADALQRIRHSPSPDLAARAREEEKILLAELDRLMTRMRAIEGQLLQIQKRATRH